jgi:hypothetical protein
MSAPSVGFVERIILVVIHASRDRGLPLGMGKNFMN